MSRQLLLDDKQIDRENSVPLYQQLAELIRSSIDREYCIGDFVLPELKLAEKYQVNRHTIRHALDELVKEGVIERKPGKGTIVVRSPISYPINESTRFTSRLEELGYETSSELLAKSIETASDEVADYLMLSSGDPVVHMQTVRLVAGSPVCVIDHYLSSDRFAKLSTRFRNGSLQHFMQKHYQIDFERTLTLISAAQPSLVVAKNLNLTSDIPVLCIKTLNCNANNKSDRIEFSISHTRSDCMQVQIGDAMQIKNKETKS